MLQGNAFKKNKTQAVRLPVDVWFKDSVKKARRFVWADKSQHFNTHQGDLRCYLKAKPMGRSPYKILNEAYPYFHILTVIGWQPVFTIIKAGNDSAHWRYSSA